jgi:chemotaxis protein methyltransferase CheR
MSAAAARRDDQATSLVEGEFAFHADDFRRIAALLYEQSGICLAESKAALVYSRLAKRLRALGLSSFSEYYDLVVSPEGEAERSAMLNALTTNLTRFYREPHHFEHLRQEVIEPMAETLRRGGRMRLWSAGCSSGQEPYTIALTVLSVLPNAPDLDVKILATDIDSNMLSLCRAGVYSLDAVEPIPAALRDRWFERDGARASSWRIGSAARSLVTFNHLNLMGAWPMKGPFQAIFCRNVVIYFDEPTQERVWSRMAPLLDVDGRLYVGHSERVAGDGGFLAGDGLTVYRKLARART